MSNSICTNCDNLCANGAMNDGLCPPCYVQIHPSEQPEQELKPCPFCGERPIFDPDCDGFLFCANCYNYRHMTVDAIGDDNDAAIKLWNKRA